MNEATKHTPGPWHSDGVVVWIDTREQACCGRGHYECCGNPDTTGGQEKIGEMGTDANARLASSAPDLAEALEPFSRALDDFRSYLTDEEWDSIDPETHLVGNGLSVADLLRARSALAKTRGEA